MPVHVALLRAVNVGGTGKLPMAELRAICEGLGFAGVETYIQSGNVLFRSDLSAGEAEAVLDEALARRLGKAPGVMIRSAAELAALVAGNPFPQAKPNVLMVNFLPGEMPAEPLAGLVAPDGEAVHVGTREIWVHYPNSSGRSKFRLPALKRATSRNLNTVAKLADLAAALERRL
ncbi:DUF1697 domain-containing protein [Rhizobium sp. TRM95111]|uniref:DUF1697 domain-containing protein n=1 Tax=Rhizobium alarense TaxID=2846851 RepID=UPI001F2DFC34|nr:DUF1697 domain-containing protein [Rhizobium alarense]MCF3638595.1 DUF1697 domain-containing protein [Rhizobium alarense]